MINNIQFKIVVGKINKIPKFYTIFARKMPVYIIRQRDRGQAEAKSLRPRPKFWPRSHFSPEDSTSLLRTRVLQSVTDLNIRKSQIWQDDLFCTNLNCFMHSLNQRQKISRHYTDD